MRRTAAALLYQIVHAEPRPPRAVDRAIPAELETIVLKAIAKSPADRYITAQEFADDLQRFLDDRPIRARRPTPADRATKWVRRHRGAALGAVLALLVMVVGLAASTAVVLHEHGQTKAALERERRANEREREQAREAAEGPRPKTTTSAPGARSICSSNSATRSCSTSRRSRSFGSGCWRRRSRTTKN